MVFLDYSTSPGTCHCGCGGIPSKGKKFLSGHNSKIWIQRTEYITFDCAFCGTKVEVRPSTNKRKYCSAKCRDDYRRQRVGKYNPQYDRYEMVCKECGKIFYAVKSQSHRKTCSIECGRASRKKTFNAKPRKIFKKGKEAAYIRDGGKCVVCQFPYTAVIHHVIPKRNGGRDQLDNLITLCPNHHYMVHAGLIEAGKLIPHEKNKEMEKEYWIENTIKKRCTPDFRNGDVA